MLPSAGIRRHERRDIFVDAGIWEQRALDRTGAGGLEQPYLAGPV